MAKNKFVEQESNQEKQVTKGNIQTVYADRIINFQVAGDVTRLLIGLETGPNSTEITHHIILPSRLFLHAIDYMTTQLKDNPELRGRIMEGINEMSERFSS